MTSPAEAKEHAECRSLALALEGIAGCLHDGRPVEAHDVARAGVYAQMVWDAGPDPGRLRDAGFAAARARFADAAKQGLQEARGAVRAESAAHEMAFELRCMANDLSYRSARAQPPDLDEMIRDLRVRYARYGSRAAA